MDTIGFLFDLDGVLIDSETQYTRIWNEIDRRYPTGRDNLAYIIKGQTLTKILNDNYPDEETRGKVSDLLHKLESEMVYSYCPGAEDFLARLGALDARTALVTSSDGVKMAHLYSDIPEFRQKMGCVIDASKVTRSKPDPEGYLLASRELDVPISRCVVFEDSVQGVKAGSAAGAYVVGITGTKTREELSPHCNVVVDSLEEVELDSLIDKLKER